MNKAQILGDSNRTRKFDDGLADKLNKEAEKDVKRVKTDTITTPDISTSPTNLIERIDMESAESIMDYLEWSAYWNAEYLSKNKKDFRLMASMADYYNIFKDLMLNLGSGPAAGVQRINLWNNLRDDINGNLLTSTTVRYSSNSVASLFQYKYSDADISKKELIHLEAADTDIITYFDFEKNFKFLQKCFGTNDDKDTIIDVLRRFSMVRRDKIRILFKSNNPSISLEDVMMFSYSRHRNDSERQFIISNATKDTEGYTRGIKYSEVKP